MLEHMRWPLPVAFKGTWSENRDKTNEAQFSDFTYLRPVADNTTKCGLTYMIPEHRKSHYKTDQSEP